MGEDGAGLVVWSIVASVICALVGALIGSKRGREFDGLLLGAFLGFIGLIILLCLPKREPKH